MRAALARMPGEQPTHPECAALFGPLFGKPERGREDAGCKVFATKQNSMHRCVFLMNAVVKPIRKCSKSHKNMQFSIKKQQKIIKISDFIPLFGPKMKVFYSKTLKNRSNNRVFATILGIFGV